MDDWVVEFREVTRKYDSVTAVDCMNLNIRRGEFFSVLGPSGCGKTTTLRLIAGFDEPAEGQILIDGKNVTNLPAFQRRVNTVFQNYALFPHLNIFENVAFGLRRRHCPEAEIKQKVREMLEVVRLPEMEKREISQLSGGQQQRVALARALVNSPDVLLLDEPLAALDKKLRSQMQFELKNLQKKMGITFVLVTHDQEEALTMSDSVAVLNKGKVEQVGTPREIYNHPHTRFVADFIGCANFLPVRVGNVHNGRTTVIMSGKDINVPSHPALKEGALADLSIRPERVSVSRNSLPESFEGNCLPGVVTNTVFMGSCTRVCVELPGQNLITADLQNFMHTSMEDFRPGENVFVNWNPASANLLPKMEN